MFLPKKSTFYIERWEVDPLHNRICSGSEKHDIEPKAMQILEYLARNAGKTVHRNDLFKAVWPNQNVTEEALTRTIGHLRQCFSDAPKSPKYIATIHKIGYRLIARVSGGEYFKNQTSGVSDVNTTSYLDKALGTIGKAAIFTFTTSLIYFAFDQPVVANLSKVKVKYITSDLGLEMAQSISPDGLNVVYKSYIEGKNDLVGHYKDFDKNYIPALMVKNIATHRVERLPHPKVTPSHPVWSPDNQRIAYAAEIKNTASKYYFAIYSTDVKTGNYTLHAETLTHNHGLTWSPDGRHIVYPDGPDKSEMRALYRLDVNTGQRELIAPKNIEGSDINYSYPKYSPDGSHIAAIRTNRDSRKSIDLINVKKYSVRSIYNTGLGLSSLEWKDNNTLFIADGSMVSKKLFEFTVSNGEIKNIPIEGSEIEYLSYSPSTKRLTFESIEQPFNIQFINYINDYEFYDFGDLTQSNKREMEAVESPDDHYTAIISSRDGSFEVWLKDNATGQTKKLTSLQAFSMQDLDWSPNSSFLSFVAETEYQKNAVYWVNVENGKLKMFSFKDSQHSLIGWDNNSILFTSDYEAGWKLWRLNTETKIANLASTDSISYGRLSPDRKTLYLVKPGIVGVWKTGVQFIDPVRIPGTENIGMNNGWTATENGLIYFMYGDIGGYDNLYFFDFKTAATRLISLSNGIYLNRINWSNNRVYYSLRGNRESDIALLENL